MTGHDDFDRTVAGWLEADAQSSVPAGGVERIRDVIRRRRPLAAWLARPGSRWVGESPVSGSGSGTRSMARANGLGWSTALILLLVLAALLGGAILVGGRLLQSPQVRTQRPGHLAYGLGGDIYVADWDGSSAVRIADGDSINDPESCGAFVGEGAIWSPDGRHLAYRSAGSDVCRGSVFIADPEGHTVASFPGSGWLVSWSPDSTRVATWVEGDGMIGIYGLDGVRQALLTVPPGLIAPGDYDPVWSPDGRSVVVPHGIEVPIDGRPALGLPVSDPRSRNDWTYSPDGTTAAYVDGYSGGSLAITFGDGSRRLLVDGGVPVGGDVWSPVWSPTGDRIAFGAEGASGSGLRAVDIGSGTVTSLVDGRGSDIHPIAFSFDGDQILYTKWDVDHTTGGFSNQALWTVGIDGSGARLLVAGTDWGDWQPLPRSSLRVPRTRQSEVLGSR